MRYRGYLIERYGSLPESPGFYLIKTPGIYGYHYFNTLEAAKARIDEWLA